jgi:hypothetical protein
MISTRWPGSRGKLPTQLACVLTSAQQNLSAGQNASHDPDLQDLVGDVIPMPAIFGGRRRLPGSLGGELADMQASMKRRIKQLEGAQELAVSERPCCSRCRACRTTSYV